MIPPETGTEAADHAPSRAERGRCVVWHPEGEGVPAALRVALERQGLRVRTRSDPHGAMAAALLESRGAGACVLVLVEPDRLRQSERVCGALRRHAPAVRVWRYDPSADPPLRGLGPMADSEGPARETPGRDAPARAGADERAALPAGRIEDPATGEHGASPLLRLVRGAERPANGVAPASRDLLSADELSMLMGDDGRGGGIL